MRSTKQCWRKYWQHQNENAFVTHIRGLPRSSHTHCMSGQLFSAHSFWDMTNKWCSTLGSLGHSNNKTFMWACQETTGDSDRSWHTVKTKVWLASAINKQAVPKREDSSIRTTSGSLGFTLCVNHPLKSSLWLDGLSDFLSQCLRNNIISNSPSKVNKICSWDPTPF